MRNFTFKKSIQRYLNIKNDCFIDFFVLKTALLIFKTKQNGGKLGVINKLLIFLKVTQFSLQNYQIAQKNTTLETLPVHQTHRIMKPTQNYDQDFQNESQDYRKQNKSIELPKINKKSNASPDLIKKSRKEPEYDEESYQNDFEQSPPKRQPVHDMNQSKIMKNSSNLNKLKKSASSSHVKNHLPGHQSESKKLSLSIIKKSTVKPEAKYMSYLETEFPQSKEQILNLPSEKINRLNQKLRNYIKRVNDQLTDLINDNMRMLKAGGLNKKTKNKTVEEQIEVLTEQKKNGCMIIQSIEKQHSNLTEQWNKLTNEEFNFNNDQQIQEITQMIKEHSKDIINLRYNVTQDGNKLTDETNYGDVINELKSKLLIVKKEVEKNQERIERNQKKFNDFSSKNPQIDARIQKLIQQAKKYNISTTSLVTDRKMQDKMQEIKKKLHNTKCHTDKTHSLNQTKMSILKKDVDNLNNQISLIQARFTQIDSQMLSTKQNSIMLIEKARNQDLQPYILTHLDFIYKNLTEGKIFQTKIPRNISNKIRVQSNSNTGVKKYASVISLHTNPRSRSQVQSKPNFQIMKKSPSDYKTKGKTGLKLVDKMPQQRVWKGEDGVLQEKEKSKQMNQSSYGSKPFIIRKSQNVTTILSQTIKYGKQISDLLPSKDEQKQNQKSSIFGPKMKYKKTETQQRETEQERKQSIITQKNSNELKQNEKGEQNIHSKPQFKIKRPNKEKIQIPQQEDLHTYPREVAKVVVVQKSTQTLAKTKSHNEQSSQIKNQPAQVKKGPNFKLTKNSKNQSKQTNTQTHSLKQESNTFPINKSTQSPKQKQNSINQLIQQDPTIKTTGRRQVQRKIVRKNQEQYVF